MGDVPPPSSLPNAHLGQEAYDNSFHASATISEGQAPTVQATGENALGFQSPYEQQIDPSQNAFSAQFNMTQQQGTGRGPAQGSYNMSAMANALPHPTFRNNSNNAGQTRYNHNGSSSGAMPPVAQYPGQSGMNPMAAQQYYMAQQASMPSYYNAQLPPAQQQAGIPRQHTMGYYTNQPMMNQAHQPIPAGYYYPHPSQYPNHNATMPGNMMPSHYMPHDHRGNSPAYQTAASAFGIPEGTNNRRASPNVVRGPPRKPRQSGHAIWIGNLPPQTDLMNLVHHVCNEAPGLESLFLISKSNCAFANFKDEQSCIQAQSKLHDSKFQTVRLVSRLRKSTVEGASGQTAPTGPSATSPKVQTVPPEAVNHDAPSTPAEAEAAAVPTKPSEEQSSRVPLVVDGEAQQQKDRFFILKSLTMEDLDLSVRNGVWATQSHNEESLNSAFKAADNVYLVFSANKSGEYFGYARMLSPINNDPAAAIEFAPKAQATNDLDLPKAIPTEATDNCPRGNIIDDSARGTIFWEVERDESETQTNEAEDSEDSASARSGLDGEQGKAWGKPFKLEWLSTTRLPFYRTRGLRNPWNSNREVKIARDGTELEPSVGRRLIGLFNRVQSPASIIPMGARQNLPMIAGYPPAPMAGPGPYPA
ncbi:hypothetical protein PFICI_00334 [Pestalotiopsis fici W106-1]|uniref:YTH domain-containing protein n=1 Tax=Pestalotiopsis fici (strain W106-1 / CGMCC3.15140) TaxID=1229662 RepID=W3XMJ2_PESFW|nr:uncharacterized protein PFICI_00334 [Pestalotiopsis fici W106-1]ETS86506.1 hypothetical protein PFICI_00334 [Pestalotiopsis fici W106-1]